MASQIWEVVGGADSGGIIVREGKKLSSPETPARLSHGALVEQLAFEDKRLHFKRLSGSGPDTGWVSPQVKGNTIVEKTDKKPESPEEQVRRYVFEYMPEVGPAASFVELPPPVPASRKPRILVLHGTAGSERIMKDQIAHLLRLAKDFEFVYVEGQIEVSEDHELVKLARNFYKKEIFRQYVRPTETEFGWRTYDGLKEGVEHIQASLREHAPVDAVLGFSQGSNLTSIIAAQAAMGLGPPLRCVVHFCTQMPGWGRQFPELFREPMPVPALIVKGALDTVTIGADEAAVLYRTVERAEHADGHRPFPRDIGMARELAARVHEFLVRHIKER